MATSGTTFPMDDSETTTSPITNRLGQSSLIINGSSTSSQQEAGAGGEIERLREYFRNPKPRNGISMHDRRRFHLGHTHMHLSFDMQNEDSPERVAHPEDELHRLHSQPTRQNFAEEPVQLNAPAEYLHDIDFSQDTSSSGSDEELDAQGRSNDNRYRVNATIIARTLSTNQGELINPGDVTIDTDMANRSNEARSVNGGQPNPIVSVQLPDSEATDMGPNVGYSTGSVNRAVGHSAVPLNASIPKQPAVVDRNNRSGACNTL